MSFFVSIRDIVPPSVLDLVFVLDVGLVCVLCCCDFTSDLVCSLVLVLVCAIDIVCMFVLFPLLSLFVCLCVLFLLCACLCLPSLFRVYLCDCVCS